MEVEPIYILKRLKYIGVSFFLKKRRLVYLQEPGFLIG
jgi:hypothetical protein